MRTPFANTPLLWSLIGIRTVTNSQAGDSERSKRGVDQLGGGALHHLRVSAIPNEANAVSISPALTWEIATKHRLGRLPSAEAAAGDFAETITDQGFGELAITAQDSVRARSLLGPLRDPFDRMLIAQALAGSLVPISIEECFDPYGVSRL